MIFFISVYLVTTRVLRAGIPQDIYSGFKVSYFLRDLISGLICRICQSCHRVWLRLEYSWSVWKTFLKKLVMPMVFMWCFRKRGGGRVPSTVGRTLGNGFHSVIRWRAGHLYCLFSTVAKFWVRLFRFVLLWSRNATICYEMYKHEIGKKGNGKSLEEGEYG
jgi:hypothetical protein